jgi:branched-chain amino acid aminotransferase
MSMPSSLLHIEPQAFPAIEKFKMPTGDIGFGTVKSPIMIAAEYHKGNWGPLVMKPYGPIELDPSCKVLHYAQTIFEGLKAYKQPGQYPNLFRPKENWRRFNLSAKRMAMPEVPIDYFMTAVKSITHYSAPFIPTKSGESLYIRPFMFATQIHVGIKPSESYLFLTFASPSASYFSGASVKVLVQRNMARAFPGGTGMAKCGGNYAASLLSSEAAYQKGYQQTLWLDGIEKKYVEEMSGMNFCCVINGEIHTPKLTDTILAGITRDTILKLAPTLGYKVHESKLEIDELLKLIKKGECTEAFCCGTAAILTPIESLNEEDGTEYKLAKPQGQISLNLRETLLNIQEGRIKDQFNWVVQVNSPN